MKLYSTQYKVILVLCAKPAHRNVKVYMVSLHAIDQNYEHINFETSGSQGMVKAMKHNHWKTSAMCLLIKSLITIYGISYLIEKC